MRNDRTWCFWTTAPTFWDSVVSRRWNRLAFYGDAGKKVQDIAPYQYQLIRGADFYAEAKGRLAKLPKVTWKRETVLSCEEDIDGARVHLESGETIRAKWVFDSRFQAPASVKGLRCGGLLQHFLGWFLTADKPVFDPETPVLMDFRGSGREFTRFFYVLPFSPTQALVEVTYFSPSVLPKAQYREELAAYLATHWAISDPVIEEEEYGVIPMWQMDTPPVPASSRIIPLGTRSGAVKPTTGYAFLRIQQQVAEMVRKLERNEHPWTPLAGRSRFAFYDALLLDILQNRGHLGKPIFERLFYGNGMPRILRFLDERSTVLQEASIFGSLPALPFLRAIGSTYLKAIPGLHPSPPQPASSL